MQFLLHTPPFDEIPQRTLHSNGGAGLVKEQRAFTDVYTSLLSFVISCRPAKNA
jgi:hypothetical protein